MRSSVFDRHAAFLKGRKLVTQYHKVQSTENAIRTVLAFPGLREAEKQVLENLREIYKNLELVNRHVAERLRNAAVQDSTLNAVIILDCYAKTLPYSVEQSLEELAYLFDKPPSVSVADS